MITIKKTIFKTPKTMTEMIEQIVIQGMLSESNYQFIVKKVQSDIKLTPEQIKWIDEFILNHIVHLDGVRQTGRTSIGIGMVLATALFKENSNSMVMASNDMMTQYHQRKTLDYLRTFCETFSLPEMITRRNRNTIELENGSIIHFRGNNINAFIGVSLDSLFLDLFKTPIIESLGEEFRIAARCAIKNSGKLIVTLGA